MDVLPPRPFCLLPMVISTASSLLVGGYWGFHRGKPIPFANRVPLGFLRRAIPGTSGQAQKRREGVGEGKGKTACWKTRLPSGHNLNPVHQQMGFLIGEENNS